MAASSSNPTPDSSYSERFLAETREHLANISAAMIALEKDPSHPRQTIEPLLRAAHSIKGGAAFSGRRNIERLAHATEEAAERIRDGLLVPGPEEIDTLLHVLDRIQALVDDLDHSDSADVSDSLARLRKLTGETVPAVSVPVVAPALPAEPGDFPLSKATLEAYRPESGYLLGVRIDLTNCEMAQHLAPFDVFTRVEQLARVLDSQTRSAGPPLAEGLPAGPLWWMGIVVSGVAGDAFRDALGIPSAKVVELRSAVSEAAKPAPGGDAAAASKPRAAAPTSLRVSVSLIDRMMSLTGELVLVRNQAIRSGDSSALRGLLRRLDSVTNDLQDAALGMRTQPVGTLFDRFPRMVRDLARQLGKQIELTVSGSEVELDKTIIELLADPLTHLIRNCCDHGIESPEKRTESGKGPAGAIHLSARQDRGQIVIEVTDDGRGINSQAVKRKALEKQIRPADELERMTPRQINELILLSGFSTAAQVTDVSGRGVGMDVVKTNIEQVGGLIEIDSTLGKGTVFSLRLPLTLAIMPCLLVDCGDQLYAIPQRDIEEVLLLDHQRRHAIERDEFGEVLRWRDRLLPVARLHDVLHGSRTTSALPPPPQSSARDESSEHSIDEPNEETKPPERTGYAAVTRLGSRRFALTFDNVHQSENIVVKPLPRLMRPLGIYSASTILGDGSVALILNSDGIARRSGVLARAAHVAARVGEAGESVSRHVLLFRTAAGDRLAIDLPEVRRIVHFRSSELQRVGSRELLTVDSAPVNVIRPEAELGLSSAADPESLFLILPRDPSSPAGLLAATIDDTITLTSPLDSTAVSAEGILGTALVGGDIALLLDLPALVRRSSLRRGADQGGPSARAASGADTSGERQRILLVEDTAFFQKLIADYLRADGFDVTVATHGQHALELLASAPFDAVISDIEMPVMDGMRFARAVREHPRHRTIPMMALTTLDTDDCRSQASRCGFNAFQVKLDRQALLAEIRSLLRTQPAASERPASSAAEGGTRG